MKCKVTYMLKGLGVPMTDEVEVEGLLEDKNVKKAVQAVVDKENFIIGGKKAKVDRISLIIALDE